MMRTQFTLFSAFKISQIVEARLLLIFIEYKYKNDLHMEVVSCYLHLFRQDIH